jgi:voltage-gated potassium channel Kch
LAGRAGAGGSDIAKAICRDLGCTRGGCAGDRGGGDGSVAAVWGLGTTGVVGTVHVRIVSWSYLISGDLPARICAGVGSVTTCGDTLSAPCLADVEGEGLRVLGDVGGDVVLADAAVRECVGVAVVLDSRHASDAGLLQADERALGPLVAAPGVCGVSGWGKCRWAEWPHTSVGRGDTVRVDCVGVVLLGCSLAGGEAGKGSNAEGDGRTHFGD